MCELITVKIYSLNNVQVYKAVLPVRGFPGGSDGKESACNVGELGSIPGEGNGYPLQYSCLENPHGQRSLEGYSPWGRKELDMTEQAHTCNNSQQLGYMRRRGWDEGDILESFLQDLVTDKIWGQGNRRCQDGPSLEGAVGGNSMIRKEALRGKWGWRAGVAGEGHSCGQGTLPHPCSPLTRALQAHLPGSGSPFSPTIPGWREHVGCERKDHST